MPIERKKFILCQEGESVPVVSYNYRENRNVFVPHKQLQLNQHVRLIEPTLVDMNSNKHLVVECSVHFIERDPNTGTIYYYFIALGDDAENLNVLPDNKFRELYYRILESTSPYILT